MSGSSDECAEQKFGHCPLGGCMPDKPTVTSTCADGVGVASSIPAITSHCRSDDDHDGDDDGGDDDDGGGYDNCASRNDVSAGAALTTQSPLLVIQSPSGTIVKDTASDGISRPVPVAQKSKHSGDDDDDTVLAYGWGAFTPSILQFMLDRRMFLVVFIASCILQGMFHTYLVSVLTTVEALFGFQSTTIALVFSATEIGQIGGSLLISYYGGKGHRPRWIGIGTLLFALCVLFCSLPHFIYGVGGSSEPLAVDKSLVERTKLESKSGVFSGSSVSVAKEWSWNSTYISGSVSLCRLNNSSPDASLIQLDNSPNSVQCDGGLDVSSFSHRQRSVLSLLFLALFGVGIGQVITSTLGITYMDDNVTNHQSPIYFAFVIGLRVFGPVLGFLLGSQCLSIYIIPGQQNLLDPSDTDWIGAWWLGMVIVSGLLLIDSIVIFGYPRRLSSEKAANHEPGPSSPPLPHSPTPQTSNNGLLGFPRAVLQLMSNDIFVFRTISSVLHILPISGLYFFLPRFVQTQFDVTAGVATAISGLAGILVMFPAVMTSGVCIKYIRPSLAMLSSWTALCAFLYSLGMMLLMFIGCSQPDIHGLDSSIANVDTNPHVYNMSLCWRDCHCDPANELVSPVCVGGEVVFSSPCRAGCQRKHSTPLTNTPMYEDCLCSGLANTTAVDGFCSSSCGSFHWFIVIFVLLALTHATSDVGSMLITLRCVQPEQKPLALGFIGFAISIFANIPCPVIYGAVIDSTCLQWTSVCGERGSCLIYDKRRFRQHFFGLTGLVMMLACCVDLIVWYKCHRRDLIELSAAVPLQPIQSTADDKQLANPTPSITECDQYHSELIRSKISIEQNL